MSDSVWNDAFLEKLFHVSIIWSMIDADESEVMSHFLFCVFQGPATHHGAIGDMCHAGAVYTVMAVEEDGLIGRIANDHCGFFELVRDIGTCVVAANIVDWQVDPIDAGLLADLLFHDDQRVIDWMGQGNDGLDIVLADDPSEGPWFLPTAAKDFAGLNFHKLAGQDIVVAMLPGLLAGNAYSGQSQNAPEPLSSVIVHDRIHLF